MKKQISNTPGHQTNKMQGDTAPKVKDWGKRFWIIGASYILALVFIVYTTGFGDNM